ncbi:DNA polymerase III subunit gamma/tau [Candidatus Saccharibacteria bacterium]|nr:DNA polymerase III subunit gamma/tau [Candidatus Saccharibacteria bacterium]
MKALYRKYRPTSLKEVIGQSQVTTPLDNAIKKGKISHAYLFIGPRGCGKTSVARIFAHEINGFKYEIEDYYPDIIEIDAASNTGVDNIRELREKATVAPTSGKYKVYIIDEVHMLSKSAFNALLKTLEEPPRHVVFIMATTDAYKIPSTITSRAQVYTFQLADPATMKSHLEDISKKEKINITPDALDIVVSRGGGSFRDSISLLDQISTIKDDEIDKETVIATLGLPGEQEEIALLSAYKQGNIQEITKLIKTSLENSKKPETLAESLIKRIMDNPEPELLPLLEKLPDVAHPFPEAKLLLAFIGNTAVAPPGSDFSQNLTRTRQKTQTTEKQPQNRGESTQTTPNDTSKAPITPSTTLQNNTQRESSVSNNASSAQPLTSSFSWPDLLSAIKEKSIVIHSSLERSSFALKSDTLYIYSPKSFDRKILDSPKNLAVIKNALPGGITPVITEDAKITQNSPQISKLSAIMGDNIQEVDQNGIPFN